MKVALYRCEDYEVDRITSLLEKMFLPFGGIENMVPAGAAVVIKPNLVSKRKPEDAATTHPAVLEGLVRILKKRTDDITFAECPGGLNTPHILESVYKVTGLKDVANRYGVKICLNTSATLCSIPDGEASKNVEVLTTIAEAKVLFNVTKLKSHSLTGMTGCAKNLYGVIPGIKKAEMHARFPDVNVFSKFVCDINRVIRPSFHILDAVTVMEGNGPTGGTPRHLGAILGGTDAFAVDRVGASLLGMDIDELPIFCAARSSGMFDDQQQLEMIGDDAADLSLCDFVMPDTKKFNILRNMPGPLRKFLQPRPAIDPKKCIGCGECAQDCPQKTIEVVRNKRGKKQAKINMQNCIRCYCCQELCPVQAVKIKRSFVSFL